MAYFEMFLNFTCGGPRQDNVKKTFTIFGSCTKIRVKKLVKREYYYIDILKQKINK